MSNYVSSMVRRSLIIAGACAVMTACATRPAATPATVADSIANNPSLSTLNTLLTSSGVAASLQQAGPFTVFAPSNDAFKALPAATMTDLQQHPDKLTQVLTYHVVSGNLMATDMHNGKIKSLQGADLEVSRSGDFVTVESAVVIQADQAAGNGVVHVIDTVLVPPKK